MDGSNDTSVEHRRKSHNNKVSHGENGPKQSQEQSNLDKHEKEATIRENEDGKGEKSEETVQVPRNIGLFGGIAFIVGSIIGSGIFVSPRGVAVGSGSIGLAMMSWTICGVVSMLGAFCYAELGVVVKQAGADYAYLHAAYGPILSYTYSWVNSFFIRPASMATITLTCAQYIMTPVFDDGCGPAPKYMITLASIVFLLILLGINVTSTKLTSRIQIIFTVAKLVALAIIIAGGIVMLCKGHTEHFTDAFSNSERNPGVIAVGLYSGMWAYDGWNAANFMTEEIINPERNLPLAIIIGVPLVMIVYILTNISYFTVMSLDAVISSSAVAVTWAEIVIPKFAWIIPVFVALSTFGAANGSMCTGGRLMFAAARNEHLPNVLAMVHVKNFTPLTSLLLQALISIILMIVGNIDSLIDFISFLTWAFYGLNMLAVIIFRYKKPYKDVHRPVKLPLVIPVLVFLASVFLVLVPIITNPKTEFMFAAGFIAIGYLYFIPFVFFKLRCPFSEKVTVFLQLYLQVLKPRDISEIPD